MLVETKSIVALGTFITIDIKVPGTQEKYEDTIVKMQTIANDT
jgi:hypothetical protein